MVIAIFAESAKCQHRPTAVTPRAGVERLLRYGLRQRAQITPVSSSSSEYPVNSPAARNAASSGATILTGRWRRSTPGHLSRNSTPIAHFANPFAICIWASQNRGGLAYAPKARWGGRAGKSADRAHRCHLCTCVPIQKTPPGLSTRITSSKHFAGSRRCSNTLNEYTRSKESSGQGIAIRASPCTTFLDDHELGQCASPAPSSTRDRFRQLSQTRLQGTLGSISSENTPIRRGSNPE